MSGLTHSAHRPVAPRRVRHEVRDGIAVMAFSLASSTTVALLLVVVTRVIGS